MKKIIKQISVVLIVLQMLMMSSSVLAVENNESVLLYSKEKLDNIEMSYYGQNIEAYYTVYNKDGVEYPAYCINYEYKGVTDEKSYSVEITENYTNIGVWRAIINGYPFKSPEQLGCDNIQEAYAATKQAVFCMLYNRDFKWYTYSGEPGKRVYDAMVKIVETARASSQIQLNTEIDLTEEEWTIDEIDSKYLSKVLTINCEADVSKFNVTLSGNVPVGTIVCDLKNNEINQFTNSKEFKILVPLGNLITNSEFSVDVNAKVNSYPMYYGKAPGVKMQNYVLTAGIVKQEYVGKTIQYLENKTKLTIKKQDLENNKLSGVKFNILDSSKNILFENMQTNQDGIIEINNVVPGKYYIQEVESLQGYEITTELLEIELKLNEKKEISVINKKIPELPEIPEEPKTPETPKIPEVPKTPEVPEILEEPEMPEELQVSEEKLHKLPRTGW